MDIFDFLYEDFKFKRDKPIKLFEAFAGIGTQHMALKRLGNEFGFNLELVGTSDWWIAANITYNSIHTKGTIVNNNDMVFNREEIIDKLLSMGFSPDDKKLATKRWYERKNDEWLKNFLKILEENKSYGAIGTFERFPKDIDVATWSFPCQDISLAGEQKGMVDGSRSNYGYVFLDTVNNTPKNERPKVLIMENVRALFSDKFKDDWRNIQLRLENMGYKNYADSLIATDYGVPQTRDRVFIVSVKGEFSYTFPKPFKLKKRLKDYLEDEVDEKYYLSDKQINQIVNWKAYNKPLENAKSENDETIQTITAKSNTSMNSSMVLIKEATKKGYSIAEDGDGIYINRPHQKRGVVQKGMIQTLKTNPSDVGVVVKDTKNYIEHESPGGIDNARRAWKEDKVIGTITTHKDNSKVLLNNPLRIRKLTPLEAWRLMGIDDEDFYKAKSSGISDSQLYKQAGNAIVVDVLVAIFKELIE